MTASAYTPTLLWLMVTMEFATCRPVSLNGGMPMPAWFDLAQLDQLLKGEQDGAGVAASIAHIGTAP